jgi:hypothetical protein
MDRVAAWAPLPRTRGVRYRRFVPDLHCVFAGCDVAVVHGGLTRTMELVAIAARSSTCCITTSSITSTFTTAAAAAEPA